MIESLYSQLADAKAQLQGEHYSRMLVYSDTPVQSEESYALISEIHGIAEQYYGDDVYVTGNATAARDLEESFSTDSVMVSVLSALFVVIVIMLVFRSAGLSLLLIVVRAAYGSTSPYRILRRARCSSSGILSSAPFRWARI